jgi:GNAT superfamily N-acetyltransferase
MAGAAGAGNAGKRPGPVTGFAVRSLTAATWPALADLFGPAGASNGCWCAYWRLGPRYRDRPREDNKRDLRLLAESARTEYPPGLVAFASEGRTAEDGAAEDGAAEDGAAEDTAVGWCELAPRADLHWLAHARYLGPVDDLPVWSVPCFYLRRGYRGQGVTGALIAAAVELAAAAGVPAIEGYPVDTAVPGHTRNAFTGTASAFAWHGFREVARRHPARPIMRKILS